MNKARSDRLLALLDRIESTLSGPKQFVTFQRTDAHILSLAIRETLGLPHVDRLPLFESPTAYRVWAIFDDRTNRLMGAAVAETAEDARRAGAMDEEIVRPAVLHVGRRKRGRRPQQPTKAAA